MESGGIRNRFVRYTEMVQDIDYQVERLARLEASALAPSSSSWDGLPGGRGTPSDRTGRSASVLADLRIEVSRLIEEEKTERGALERLVSALPPDERAVLRLRYIDLATWEDTADTLGVTDRGARKIGERAFDRLERTYGKEIYDGPGD